MTIGNVSDVDMNKLFTEDYSLPGYLQVINIIFLITVFTLALPGNALILGILSSANTRSSTDWFVIVLALSDICATIGNIPVHLILSTNSWQRLGNGALCSLHYFVYIWTFYTSALLFVVIALNRYMKVCCPRRTNYLQRYPLRVASVLVVIFGCIAARRAILAGNNNSNRCVFEKTKHVDSGTLTVINGLLLLVISLTICFIYTKVILRMRKVVMPVAFTSSSGTVHLSVPDSRPRPPAITTGLPTNILKSSRMLIAMTFMFLSCTVFPNLLALFLFMVFPPWKWVRIVCNLLSRLYYINVFINPYVFLKMSSEFRRKASMLLQRWLVCHE